MTQGIVPVLLVLWYTLSITGLDVHHDHEHGKTYVVACALGTSCETIHPESHCHDGECSTCMDGEECCSDEFHIILSQGEDAGNSAINATTTFEFDFIPESGSFFIYNSIEAHKPLPTPPLLELTSILDDICILRV